MKSLIIAILIAVIIIFGGIYATNKLSDVSDNLIEICEQASELIQNEEFETAGELLEKMKESVDENYIMFAVSIDHNEIDKIEMNLDQMQIYIKEHQKADALAFGNVLLGLFEHLPKDYKLKLENVL